jgi:hypothetical protein
MRLFGRSEPLHVRLAREGGLDLDGADPDGPRPPWDSAGIHGNHRARQWDTVTTVEAPDLPGDRIGFVALPDGELVVDEGGGDLTPLVDALALEPPYRAEAVRRTDTLWALGASRIEVVQLPGVQGEQIELASHGEERTLLIDGQREFGSVPALERPDHVVRAHRIAGDAWEVETDPL